MAYEIHADKIIITDSTVVDFYNNYKFVDIVKINKQYINIIKNLNADIEKDNVNMEIINLLHEMKKEQMYNFVALNKNISISTDANNNNMKDVFIKIKDEFINNVKMIIENNDNKLIENTRILIDKSNEINYNKLENFLYTKLNNSFKMTLQSEFNNFYKDIERVFPDLLISKIFNLFDNRFTNMDNMNNVITEIRFEMNKNCINKEYIKIVTDNIDIYKEKLIDIPNALQDLMSDVKNKLNEKSTSTDELLSNITSVINNNYSIILDKYNEITNYNNKINNNSSIKGRVSEDILHNILVDCFPQCNIEKTAGGSESHRGDFILSFDDNIHILIENKLYANNVNSREVQKFKDDVVKCGMCGIMLSQKSGIANKSDFHIEIDINNNILIYLHNVEYAKEKILLSVNIIKSLSKLDNFSQQEKDAGGIHITKFQLEQLYDSYSDIEKNTKKAITHLEDFYIGQKKIITDIKISNIQDIVTKFYVNNNSEDSKCKYCGKKYTSRGIKLHMNKCPMNGM